MVLIIAVEDYLYKPLVELAQYIDGEETRIISLKANRHLGFKYLFKLFFYYLPFKISKVITPSDLGGRLIRVILDYAKLLNKETFVVPVHNLPCKTERKLTFWKRYTDVTTLEVVGGFSKGSKKTKLLINDRYMREYYKSMGFEDSQLILLENWITEVFSKKVKQIYPAVFFTEMIQEINEDLFYGNIERIRLMLEEKIASEVYIKFHPREKQKTRELYLKLLGMQENLRFLDSSETNRSLEVINRTKVIISSFSSVLLEALWLDKKIIILDNQIYTNTLLQFYLKDKTNYFVYQNASDIKDLRKFVES